MSQSLSNIFVHIVFSTKERKDYLQDDIRIELHAYIGGIVINQKGVLLKAGSVVDHIHLLVAHPRTCSPANLIKEIKIGSSKWLKNKSKDFENFAWQNGYGIFSIRKNMMFNGMNNMCGINFASSGLCFFIIP